MWAYSTSRGTGQPVLGALQTVARRHHNHTPSSPSSRPSTTAGVSTSVDEGGRVCSTSFTWAASSCAAIRSICSRTFATFICTAPSSVEQLAVDTRRMLIRGLISAALEPLTPLKWAIDPRGRLIGEAQSPPELRRDEDGGVRLARDDLVRAIAG